MPPLLMKLSQRPCREQLQWLGVSYGLTGQLHKFWKRAGYVPVYLRQTTNELTGEHTCIMLKTLASRQGSELTIGKDSWLSEFSLDFKRRFLELLAYQFKEFSPLMVLNLLEACSGIDMSQNERRGIETGMFNCNLCVSLAASLDNRKEVHRHFTSFDLKRLDSYSQNLLDYHVILDLVCDLAKCYFMGRLERTNVADQSEKNQVKLSAVQSAILAGIGLQKKSVEDLEKDLGLPVSQILALFAKSMRKSSVYLHTIVEKGFAEEIEIESTAFKNAKTEQDQNSGKESEECVRDAEDEEAWDPLAKTLDQDLEEAGSEEMKKYREKQRAIIEGIDMSGYAIAGTEEDWESVKVNGGSNIVSVKNADSQKKRKLHGKDGVAASLASKNRGESTGIYDPKGLLAKKSKKKHKKSKI